MKQGEGRDVAHDLYVYQQMTYQEIATRCDRTEKTIRDWSEKGGWRAERERLMSVRISTHEKLHKVVDVIAASIIADQEAGREPSPQRILALNKIAVTLKSLYQYEGNVTTEAAKEVGGIKATPEDIALRVRELLGV